MDHGRRGTVTDIPAILIAILGLGIGVIISKLVLDTVVGATSNAMINQAVLQKAQGALLVFDAGTAFVTVSLFAVSGLLAWRIRTSPIFIVPSLLFLAPAVWLASELANVYSLFANTGAILSTANQYPAIAALFENLPLVTAVFGGVIVILLFARRQSPGGQNVEVSA